MKAFFQAIAAWGLPGVLVLSFIDSVGVPNPSGTDALLLLVCIARPDSAFVAAALAVLGCLAGSLVFHQIIRSGGERILARYITTGRGLTFRMWFQRYGLVTVFISALLPIPVLPLKVLAACACATGVS